MMKQSKYVLNNIFEANFETDEIRMKGETSTDTNIKVEPRIMSVLEILIRNSPEVVSREQLIDQVWNNYGGADDALNQAISHLRKILSDGDKENRIIETVVKKGYRFAGSVDSENHQNGQIKNYSRKIKKKTLQIIGITLIIAGLIATIYLLKTSDKSSVPLAPKAETQSSINESITVPNPK